MARMGAARRWLAVAAVSLGCAAHRGRTPTVANTQAPAAERADTTLQTFLTQPHPTLLTRVLHDLAQAYVAQPLQPLPIRRFQILLSVLSSATPEERAAALPVLGGMRHWHRSMAHTFWPEGPGAVEIDLSPLEQEVLVAAFTSGTRAETAALYQQVAPHVYGALSPWVLRLEGLASSGRCPALPLRTWDHLAEVPAANQWDTPPPPKPVPCTPNAELTARIDAWHYRGHEALFADLDEGRVALEDALPHVLARREGQSEARWPTEAVRLLVHRVRALPAERRAVAVLWVPSMAERVEPTPTLFAEVRQLTRETPVGSRGALLGYLHEHTSEADRGELTRLGRQEILPEAEGAAVWPNLTAENALRILGRTWRAPMRYDTGPGPQVAHLPPYDFERDVTMITSVIWPEEKHIEPALLDVCTEASRASATGTLDPMMQNACSSAVFLSRERVGELEKHLSQARGMYLLQLAGNVFSAGRPLPQAVRDALAEDPMTRAPFFDFLKSRHASAALFPPRFATEQAMLESMVVREVSLALGGPPDAIERIEVRGAAEVRGRIDVRFRVNAPRPGAERDWMRGFVSYEHRDLRASRGAIFVTRYGATLPRR
jgi:hypothetical protein